MKIEVYLMIFFSALLAVGCAASEECSVCRADKEVHQEAFQSNQVWQVELGLTSTPARRVTITMIPIKTGTFMMGSEESGMGNRRVSIHHPFYMSETEITMKQYKQVLGRLPVGVRSTGDIPAYNVWWYSTVQFCQKLNELKQADGSLPEGYAFRLPTEEEWEYACRAGTTGDYAGELAAMGWYALNGQIEHDFSPRTVRGREPNAWGLYDMHGGVWEWCSDKGDDGQRIARGGSYTATAESCRSHARQSFAPSGITITEIGFRLVLSREDKENKIWMY